MVDLVSDRVSIPEEERVRHARGEGDLQHLPGLRVSHLLPTSIYYHISGQMSTPFLKFLKKIGADLFLGATDSVSYRERFTEPVAENL